MYTTSLRKVGGSVMLAVSPSILDVLKLQAGSEVGMTIEQGRLVISPAPRPAYTLAELLAASDYTTGITSEDRAWLDAPRIGGELL